MLLESGANVGGEDINALLKPPTPAKQPRDLYLKRDGTMQMIQGGHPVPLPPDFQRSPDDVVHQEPAPPGGSGQVQITLPDTSVDFMARQYMQDKKWPNFGQGQAAAHMRAQFINKVAELSGQYGVNPVANAADLTADQGALTQTTKSLAAINSFESNAQKNLTVMENAMKRVTDTGIPIANGLIRDVQRMAGSPDVAAFQASMKLVIPEIAKIVTNPNLSGQLSDSARKEIDEVIRGDANVGQLMRVTAMLRQEMTNRRESLVGEQEIIHKKIASRAPGTVTNAGDDAAAKAARKAELYKKYGTP